MLSVRESRSAAELKRMHTGLGALPYAAELVKRVSFIVMIDDLRADCEVNKFVDDTTVTELITPSYSASNMSDYLSSLLIWTTDNDMQLKRKCR